MSNLSLYEKAFIDTFGIKSSQLKKLKYQGVQSWDSVGHMNLIMALEESFDIEMDIDDIIDLSSFDKGKKILKNYKINI